jgi:hypothetical protein
MLYEKDEAEPARYMHAIAITLGYITSHKFDDASPLLIRISSSTITDMRDAAVTFATEAIITKNTTKQVASLFLENEYASRRFKVLSGAFARADLEDLCILFTSLHLGLIYLAINFVIA